MVGILGNILAGGVAGGAKEYAGVMDDRIEDKRAAAKAAALEKRLKSMARYQQSLRQEDLQEQRTYTEGRENVQDADAKYIAALLRNEERGKGTGILAETGGDVYSAPMTGDDLTTSMTGKGQLAYEEKRMAMEKEDKAASRADEKFAMEKEKHKTMQEKLKKEIKLLGKTKWVPRDLYKNGKEVKAMTQAEYLMYRKDGFTPVKGGDGVSAGEMAGFKAIEWGGIAGMDAPKDKEIWEFFDEKGAQQFKKWADENGLVYAATPIGEDGGGARFLISTKMTKPMGEKSPQANNVFDETKSYTAEEAQQMGGRKGKDGKWYYPVGNGQYQPMNVSGTNPPPNPEPPPLDDNRTFHTMPKRG